MEEVPVAAGRQVASVDFDLVCAGVAFALGLAESAASDVEELELYGLGFRKREADGGVGGEGVGEGEVLS